MPINVTIKCPGSDFGFTWECNSDEAHELWDECETMADQQGVDASGVAGAVIQSLYKDGEPKTEERARIWAPGLGHLRGVARDEQQSRRGQDDRPGRRVGRPDLNLRPCRASKHQGGYQDVRARQAGDQAPRAVAARQLGRGSRSTPAKATTVVNSACHDQL